MITKTTYRNIYGEKVEIELHDDRDYVIDYSDNGALPQTTTLDGWLTLEVIEANNENKNSKLQIINIKERQ